MSPTSEVGLKENNIGPKSYEVGLEETGDAQAQRLVWCGWAMLNAAQVWRWVVTRRAQSHRAMPPTHIREEGEINRARERQRGLSRSPTGGEVGERWPGKETETKGGGGAASRSAPCSSATKGSRRYSRDSTSESPLAPAASSSAPMDQVYLTQECIWIDWPSNGQVKKYDGYLCRFRGRVGIMFEILDVLLLHKSSFRHPIFLMVKCVIWWLFTVGIACRAFDTQWSLVKIWRCL